MLIDLLSTNNQVSYNIKVAEIVGLHASIYLSELININSKAIRKNKVSDDGYIKVDRKYLTSRTTLDDVEQKEIESTLADLKILIKSPNAPNEFKIDINQLASIMMSGDSSVLSVVKKITAPKKVSKVSARRAEFDRYKEHIECFDDEIKLAYQGWIDGVFANPNGFLSEKAVDIFVETVDNFACGDKTIALKVIEIATVNGYRDANWAISTFNKDFADKYRHKAQIKSKTSENRKLGNEVF